MSRRYAQYSARTPAHIVPWSIGPTTMNLIFVQESPDQDEREGFPVRNGLLMQHIV
jgi:hypothetical protein